MFPHRGAKGRGSIRAQVSSVAGALPDKGADALLACWVATGPHPSPGHPLPITHKEEVGEVVLPNASGPYIL